jgi:hemerythrin-like domain-containing protein
MDALEVLLEEHEIIEKAIEVLNKSVKNLQTGKKVSPEVFEKILDIIKNFADKCHHGKEETVLFPLMKKRDAKETKIISLLLEEHEKGRTFVRVLSESISKNDINNIIKNANGYVSLLPQHIKKENVIFPKWINPLSNEIKEELFEKFEEIEEKIIGLGKHQEYVQNIEKLKNSL